MDHRIFRFLTYQALSLILYYLVVRMISINTSLYCNIYLISQYRSLKYGSQNICGYKVNNVYMDLLPESYCLGGGLGICSGSGKPRPPAWINLDLGAGIRSMGSILKIWGLKETNQSLSAVLN